MYGSVGRNRMGIGPVKNSAFPIPQVSLAFNDLGAGQADISAGSQVGLSAPTFSRATFAWARRQSGFWIQVNSNIPRAHYLLGNTPQYVRIPGLANNYVSSPDTAITRISGNVSFRALISADNWVGGVGNIEAWSKWLFTGNQRGYRFGVQVGTGQLFFVWTEDGSSSQRTFFSSVAVNATDGLYKYIRCDIIPDNGNRQSVAIFYTSDSGSDNDWQQLGTVQVQNAPAKIFASTSPIEIGTTNGGGGPVAPARIAFSRLYTVSSTGALTLIANFDATRAAAVGSTSFVATTGETWTVNGLAYIDSNPVYGGYLFETAATQLVTPSAAVRDMTDASWVKTNMTASFTGNGIDNVPNSSTILTASAANGTVIQTLVAAASSRTYSALIRRRIGTGTVSLTQDGGGSWTDVSAQLNGSQFIQVQLNASVLNAAFGIRLGTNGDAIEVGWNQFEAGDCATTPIPLAGTRNSDTLVYSFTPVTQGVGTLYAELTSVSIIAGSNKVEQVVLDNSAANNIIVRILTGSVAPAIDATINNGAVYDSSGGTPPVKDVTYRNCIAYSNGSIASCSNISAIETGAGVPPTDINRLLVTQSVNSSACVKNIRIWPTRLIDNQIKALTGP